MQGISSLREFLRFRQRVLKHKELKEPKPCLVVSNGTGSQASGSNRMIRKIKRHILKERLQDKIRLRRF